MRWGMFPYQFGAVLNLFWDRFNVVLKLFWNRFGIFGGRFRDRFGVVLGMCLDRPGNAFGVALGLIFEAFEGDYDNCSFVVGFFFSSHNHPHHVP